MAGLFDMWGGGGGNFASGASGMSMPYNTLAGLGMGLMAGTVSNPYGAAMQGFQAGANADSMNQYRQYQMRQAAADRARQAQRDKIADDRWQQSFDLQKDQALAAGRGFEYRNDANGNLVKIEKATGRAEVVNPDGADSGGANPYAYAGKPMTEAQSKDALYASRMFGAEKVLRDKDVTAAGADPIQRGMNAVPGVGNYMTSGNFQAFDQAARDFINATLRRESGAVISDKEFDNAYKQYLPRPGDSEQVLKQKQANRIEAIKGISAGAGRNYRVPYTFDDNGNIVEDRGGGGGKDTETRSAFGPKPKGTTKSGIPWSVD